MKFTPIWFDSLGAKSSCTLIQHKNTNILIDPGIAIMHPSYPAPTQLKIIWTEEGRRKIEEAAEKANIIIITVSYTHLTLPTTERV